MPIIKVQYCLTCGYSEPVYQDENGTFHFDFDLANDYYRICEGPFAVCPPDELEENWQDNLPALSPGEYYLLQGSHISYDVETDQNINLELI